MKCLFNFSLSIAIFMLSLRVMSTSIQAVLGARLRRLLTLLTYNPLISVVTGAFVTATIQSSSAVAALMVALVNAGVLNLKQAFGVILGANIGTTITAQLAAWDMSRLIVPTMLCGLFLLPGSKKHKYTGACLIGLGGLFFGLYWLKLSLLPILEKEVIRHLLVDLSENVYLAVLVGIGVTAVVQSSSAVTSVIIILGHIGAIPLMGAIGIALGSNIGTVGTTLISSLGMSKEARATAYADLMFNVLGVLLVLPIIKYFTLLVSLTSPYLPQQIANAHTLFNVFTAFVALLLIDPLTRAVCWIAGIK